MSKGISLYLGILIMSILIAMGLGLSTILVSQIKMMTSIEDSVLAFYAADTGIEEVLLSRDNPVALEEQFLSNGGSYEVLVFEEGCINYCIKSIGKYKNTRRAIEVSY